MSERLKVIISIILITVITVIAAGQFSAVEIVRYYGDVNNDSYVTTDDAKLCLLSVVGIESIPTGIDFTAADINKDGKLTTEDARLILKTAAGQISKEAIEGYEFDENPKGFLKLVNGLRADEGVGSSLTLSNDLCEAAKIAAEEYVTKTGTALTREDGSYYYKLLDENGISYTVADKIIISSSFGYKETFDAMVKVTQSKKALCSKNFSKFGIGAYTKDGHTFYWCVLLTD
ncbi:MAG: dockerin type I domain-containing protein [Acutalibacteraceae bacterium]